MAGNKDLLLQDGLNLQILTCKDGHTLFVEASVKAAKFVLFGLKTFTYFCTLKKY